jgi:hypothetical protein
MDAVVVRETPIVLSLFPIDYGQLFLSTAVNPSGAPAPAAGHAKPARARLDDDAGIAERGARSSGQPQCRVHRGAGRGDPAFYGMTPAPLLDPGPHRLRRWMTIVP